MRAVLTLIPGGEFTQPNIASLVDPLFASWKEGKKSTFINLMPLK